MRITVAGLVMLPVFLYNIRKIKANDWPSLIIVGLLGNGITAILFPMAQTQISSALAGTLNSLTPLFVLLVGALLFGQRLTTYKVLGIITGLIGTCLLVVVGADFSQGQDNRYALFIVLATISYGYSSNVIKTSLQHMPAHIITAGAFMFLLPFSISGLFLFDVQSVVLEHEYAYKSLMAIASLAVMSTVIASILYIKLIQMTDAVFASTISYVAPFVALTWGLLDKESLGLIHVLGLAVILLGVRLTSKG